MFDKDVLIKGKHATYLKALAKNQGDKLAPEGSVNFKIFDRYIDAYMLAPIIGMLNGRKSGQDDSKDSAGMLAEIIIKNQPKLKYIYRLVVLLDDDGELSKEDRINRAFREDNNENSVSEGMKLFNSYMLGGLEVLYETFVLACTTDDDYINKIYEFVTDFKKEQEIDLLEIDVEKLLRR